MLDVWWYWKKLYDAWRSYHLPDQEFKRLEAATLRRLEELCAPEIKEAFKEVGIERMSEEDAKRVYSSIYQAVRTITNLGHKLSIEKHVKVCVKEALVRRIESLEEWFYQAEADHLLPPFLCWQRPAVAELASYLGDHQRAGLREMLYHRFGGKPFPLRLDYEPKEQDRWLLWYLWRQEFEKPEVKSALGGIPRIIVVCGRGSLRFNRKTGNPMNPLGPMDAKIWMALGREMNKYGHLKDPESKSRIARSLGVSRSTVDRYLEADIPINLMPDSKGGVDVEGTLEDILTSIEIFSKKPGPSSEDS